MSSPVTAHADICVIGSGIAGAIVAQTCLDAGQTVVMLEAGSRASGRAKRLRLMEVALRSYNTPRMKVWHRDARYQGRDYQSRGRRRYPLDGLALIVRGGSTMGWTGFAYRQKPEDFKLASLTGRGLDWPIDYSELEPFYVRAEQTMRVTGDDSDSGHPPRSSAFPVAARAFHRRDKPFREVFDHNSWSTLRHCAALASDGGAFTADEVLDTFEDHPSFRLIANATATRIECTSTSMASSVSYWDSVTDTHRLVAARTFVVCAGGIESTSLLLNSTDHHPVGLGNHSGHLGRHLVSHSGVTVGGQPKGFRWINGPIAPTAASRAFDTVDEQAKGKYVVLWRPSAKGFMSLNACVEQLPHPDNRIVLGKGKTRFGSAKPYVYFDQDEQHRRRIAEIADRFRGLIGEMGIESDSDTDYIHAHPLCTTRMSEDPADGVVDRDLRIHSVDNVYVCGSSAFTTGAAAHPTVTVAALAHRLGAHLSELGALS